MSASFSKLDTYGRCPKLFEYKYVRDLQPKKQDSNLFRGITAHDMLRDWYLQQREVGIDNMPDPGGFVNNWLHAYWEEQDTEQAFADVLFDHQKEVEQIGEIVKRFLLLGVFDDWEILHVEEEFIIQIGEDEVTFTPDLVARDPDGVVWIIDHKTSGKHIDRDALDIKPQALLYYVGVSQFYDNVGGFVFNYIRKKVPTVPRLNKTGKKAVNDLNRIDTDYQTLFEFCSENGLLDDAAHRRRLGELRDVDRFFFRHPFYVTPDMVDETVIDTASRLSLMKTSLEHGLFPRTIQPFNGCNRCGFRSLCFTELTGGNTQIVLEWYEPRDEKNPYEREDEE